MNRSKAISRVIQPALDVVRVLLVTAIAALLLLSQARAQSAEEFRAKVDALAQGSFDEREKGFEAKYKHDQEIQFKVTARRNRLLGLWAAEQLGLSGAEADAYAKSVVVADLEKPGDEDVVKKVLADLSAKGVQMSERALRKRISEFADVARKQIGKEAS